MYLLLVEDNPTDRMVIQARLRHAFPSAQILAADDPIAMNEHLKRDGCDIVITDYWLGWSDGLSILQRVRDRWPRSRVIMLTGNGGEEVVAGAFKHGLYHYLLKPDGFEELAAVTGAAMESKRREDFNELMAMIVNSIPDGVHGVDAAGRMRRGEFDNLLDAMVRDRLIEIEEAVYEKDGEVRHYRKSRALRPH